MKVPALAPFLLAWAGMLAAPVPAGDDANVIGDDYQSGDFARIRFEENGATILRAQPDRAATEDAGSVNAPVFSGDAVRTGRDQRVEIELAGGSLVRLDQASELIFLSLPSPYATYQDNVVLQLVQGTARITARLEGKEFRVDTPSSTVYLLDDGDFRIEATDRGRTIVSSWRGVAEVAGQGGSVLVRAGMRSEVHADSVPGDPYPFNTLATDGFDRWVGRRDDSYRTEDSYGGGYDRDDEAYSDEEVYDSLPYEVRPYYGELSRAGRWIFVSGYGYCWYPNQVRAGWRPYSAGYWHYRPSGYFWVSNEPWGWAPYHYGRWNWVTGHGWCWVPGRVFAGAWVSWSWGSAHIGWAPLNFWNRPAFISTIHYGFYDPFCWTFVPYAFFGHRHFYHHTVNVHHIGHGLRRHAVVTRAPRVAPRDLADNPAARTRAVATARDDRLARVTPVDRDATRLTRFSEVEDRLARRGGVARQGPGRGTASGSSAGGTRARAVPVPGTGQERARDGEAGPATRSGARGTRAARFPRRIIADESPARVGSGERRETSAAGRGRAVPRTGDRGTARSGQPTRDSSGASSPRARSLREQTEERRRDLYRRMARPRETRDRSSGQGRSASGSGSSPRTQARQPAPRAAGAERGSSSQRSGTAAKPSGSRSSSGSKGSSARRSGSSTRSRGSGSGDGAKESGSEQHQQRSRSSLQSSRSRPYTPSRSSAQRQRSQPQRPRTLSPSAPRSQPRRSSVAPQRSRPSSTPRARSSSPQQRSRSTVRPSPSRRSAPSRSSSARGTPSRGSSGSRARPSTSRSSGARSSRGGRSSSSSSRGTSGSKGSGKKR